MYLLDLPLYKRGIEGDFHVGVTKESVMSVYERIKYDTLNILKEDIQ